VFIAARSCSGRAPRDLTCASRGASCAAAGRRRPEDATRGGAAEKARERMVCVEGAGGRCSLLNLSLVKIPTQQHVSFGGKIKLN